MSSLKIWYQKRSLKIAPYIFITPNIILFLLFMIIPLFFTFLISFYDWGILGEPRFIGLANYKKMIMDRVFWVSLWNTLYYTIGTVPVSMSLGLAGAILLNRKIPLRTFFRGVFYAPSVVSLVATGLIWAWMYNPNYGLINYLLSKVGIKGVEWLASPSWAMPAVIITTIWVRTGYCLVLYLAGLQGIPDSVYEAAEIDGTNGWQKFWYITLPLLRNTTVFVLIISVIYGFMVFDLVYIMTKGGPGFSTTVIVQYIYQKAFVEGEMGYASALGTILLMILMAIATIQLKRGEERN